MLVTRLDDTVDTDADGAPDHYLSRELAVALDPATGQIAWQHSLARAVVTDPNLVPKFFVCPTPAAFATDGGAALLAVASSLAARVAMLDPASGQDLNDVAVAGPALASPVMANGRLITVAFSGVVEGQVSAVNHPPAAPVLAGNPNTLDAADVTLRWLPATDPDAEMPTYEVRIDSDGEVLQSYTQQLFPGQGATSVALTPPLAEGVVYTVAVRARDAHGAYSPWSAAETFTVATPPPVTVNGNPVASLRAAVENAMAGDMVLLGAGTYPLSSTLHVAGGVTVTGAGAGRTILDGRGLAVGISFTATDPKAPTGPGQGHRQRGRDLHLRRCQRDRHRADASGGARLRDRRHRGRRRRHRGRHQRDAGRQRHRPRFHRQRDDQEQPRVRQPRRPGGRERRQPDQQLRRPVRQPDGPPGRGRGDGRSVGGGDLRQPDGARLPFDGPAGFHRPGRSRRRRGRRADAQRRAASTWARSAAPRRQSAARPRP